jgi:hypothetical protein
MFTTQLLVFFISTVTFALADDGSQKNPAKGLSEFEIYYSSNNGPINMVLLDTKKNLLSVLRCDPEQRIESKVQLSKAQKNRIIEEIKTQQFMTLSEDILQRCDHTKGTCTRSLPHHSVTVTVTLNNKEKRLRWSTDTSYDPQNPELVKFQKVTGTINDVILELENDLKMKGSRCGFG